MGCWTAYLVRKPDGSCGFAGEKWGQVEFGSAAELLAALDQQARAPVGADDDLRHSWCEGWYVDRARRFARVYRCSLRARDVIEGDRALREAPGWAGWDVGVADERYFDVAELAGMRCAPDDHQALLDGWVSCRAAGHLTCHVDPGRFPHRWDPDARVLRHDVSHYHDGVELTAIGADGQVRSHGFTRSWALFEALGRGLPLLDELAAVAPCPPGYGEDEGALIDAQRRELWVWTSTPIGPVTFAALRQRWPGWTVARDRAGGAGRTERDGLRFITVLAEEVAPPALSTEETRLIAAVHAAPDDDEPRRAYARYLRDRGDERGAMIEVQVQLDALVRAGVRSAHRLRLEAEARRLACYADVFVPGLGDARFRRGFPAEAQVESVAKLVETNVLAAAPTIDHVSLRKPLDADEARALVGVDGWARVRSLEVRPAGGLRVLAEAGGGLRTLTLSCHEPAAAPAADELDVLAAPGALAGVEELALWGRGFDVRTTVAALERLRVPALTRLRLQLERMDHAAVVALRASRCLGWLRSLEVTGLDGATAVALVDGAGLGGVRHLGLFGADLRDDGLDRLLARQAIARLTSLELERANLTATGLLALAHCRALDGIVELRLRHAILGRVEEYGDALAALRARFGDALSVA